MNHVLLKIRNSLQREGLVATLLRTVKYPARVVKRQHFARKVLQLNSAEDKFTWIYKSNHWSSEESASGLGSTLKYTEKLRQQLPGLFREHKIRKVFDAPCGDFNWMRLVVRDTDIDYVGGDIVQPLIQALNRQYGSSRIRFVHIDLTQGTFPAADLMICRDCLFHLSFRDTRAVLANFVRSGIPYLLTTSHVNTDGFHNVDIPTGGFRRIDLYAAPYHFPRGVLSTVDDWVEPDPPRQMGLWSREQVEQALSRWRLPQEP